MTITRTQLKSEISQRFKIASVAEITQVRIALNHEDPNSVELSDAEANMVRQWFEKNGEPITINSRQARKVRTDNAENENAIVASAQQRHSALLSAGIKTGVNEADDFQQTRQAGFVKRLEQHNQRDAEMIEQQLLNLCGFVSQTTEIDVDAIAGLPIENFLEGKQPELLLPPEGGIGFFSN